MCDMIGYLNFSLTNHNSYKCFDVTVFIIVMIDVLAMQFRNNRIEFENLNSIGIYDLIAKMPQHVDIQEPIQPNQLNIQGLTRTCKEYLFPRM